MAKTTEQVMAIVQQYLLDKAQKAGIEIREDCPLKNFASAYSFNGKRRVLTLKENPTTEERIRSLACCLAFSKTPGGYKKTFRFEEINGYFWLEAMGGQRNPEIDRRADRYISFLLHKAQKQE